MQDKTVPPRTSSKTHSLSDRGVLKKSNELDFKSIALGVCGGIASVEIVKVSRELKRHGASVTAFLTPDAERFITELSVEWATGGNVVTQANAEVDYLESYDLVLVVPATLNTLSKCALALTDNVVTLLVASQLGSGGKVAMVPTMNLSLKKHPLYQEHCQKLQSWGVQFYEFEEEGRLKMPPVDSLVAEVKRYFS